MQSTHLQGVRRNLAVALAILCTLALPLWAAGEEVRSFAAEYVVGPDGAVSVQEVITYDFGDVERHGIFRELDTQHPSASGSWLRERVVAYDLTAVTRAGSREPYTVTRDGSTVRVKVGDPDRTITGLQTYVLTYTLRGALSYDPTVEFYWNVTGDRWDVPIREVVARVRATGTATRAADVACYAGSSGSTQRCAQATSTEQETVFRESVLAPGEELTIAQALASGSVAVATHERWQLQLVLVPLAVFAAGVLGWLVYRFRTHHRPEQAIIARYEPFSDLLPMYTGVIMDGRLDPRDITAGIVYLAQQGFLKIRHIQTTQLWIFTSGDYELTLLRPMEEAPNEASRAVLTLMFSDGADRASLSSWLDSAGQADGDAPTGNEPSVGTTVTLSELARHKKRNARKVRALQKYFKQRLRDQGYFEQANLDRLRLRYLVGGLVVTGVIVLVIIPGLLIPLIVLGVLGSIVLFAPRRSQAGYAARWHLLGFKDFLSVTDRERFTFHNAPEKNPELFMQYLPYAIALGVEEQWAEAFRDITLATPVWYEDATGSSFSAAAFASDMGAFSSSFSASSGASGSSGGGSAGGGAGGGGGGSW